MNPVKDAKWLQKLQDLYSATGGFSVENLAYFYCADAVFIDPVHEVKGLHAMQSYFNCAYANLDACHFEFTHHAQSDGQLFIAWEMTFRHPKLKSGQAIRVPGTSHLQLSGEKIIYHRDHYDIGCMLYDNIPILGSLTAWIKRKLVP
jgi:hypothetical protein